MYIQGGHKCFTNISCSEWSCAKYYAIEFLWNGMVFPEITEVLTLIACEDI
jgi:hypothetical protein